MANITLRPLPSNCYSTKSNYLKGILIHHISALKTKPTDPYDPEACWKIFASYKVSAHYMITRDGEIWGLVPDRLTAWHAGKSYFKGLKNINQYFLGYEFIGSHLLPYTDAQYEAGAWLARKHMIDYNIPTSWITGHQMVSTYKVRSDPKNDPSEQFDWIRFGGLILEKEAGL